MQDMSFQLVVDGGHQLSAPTFAGLRHDVYHLRCVLFLDRWRAFVGERVGVLVGQRVVRFCVKLPARRHRCATGAAAVVSDAETVRILIRVPFLAAFPCCAVCGFCCA